MVWVILIFIWGALFGWIGVAIAQNKGVSSAAGFWLGAFLGPIGLVIVALLSPPREEQPQQPVTPQKFEGERTLANDAYKLWLTARYSIKRNDVLDSYVIGERLFPSVHAALEYAKEQQDSEIEAVEAEARRKAEERERQRAASQKAYEEADARFQKRKPYIVFASTLAAIGFGYLLYLGVKADAERTRIEQQQAAAAKRKHEAELAPFNATLAPLGVGLGDNAKGPATDTDENPCIFRTNAEQTRKIVGKPIHFFTATYPPDQTITDVKLNPRVEWEDISGTLDTLLLGADHQWLYRNRKSGKELIVTAQDQTNYKADAGDLSFNTKVSMCVGEEIGWN
jgi:hypothetical protein